MKRIGDILNPPAAMFRLAQRVVHESGWEGVVYRIDTRAKPALIGVRRSSDGAPFLLFETAFKPVEDSFDRPFLLKALTDAGHTVAKAFEIAIDYERGDLGARRWVHTLLPEGIRP